RHGDPGFVPDPGKTVCGRASGMVSDKAADLQSKKRGADHQSADRLSEGSDGISSSDTGCGNRKYDEKRGVENNRFDFIKLWKNSEEKKCLEIRNGRESLPE